MPSDNKYTKEDAYRALEIANSWINNVDAKVSFALAYMAVLVGFVFYNAGASPNAFQSFLDAEHRCCCVIIGVLLVVCLYISCFASTISFLLALFSRIKNTSGDNSAFFFGTISRMKLEDFKAKVADMTDKDIMNDVVEQVHTNSKICIKKLKLYNFGIYLLGASTLLCIICMMLHYFDWRTKMEVTTRITYSIENSSKRMNDILDAGSGNFSDKESIPARSTLTYTNGYYVDVTALFIDMVS